MSVDTLEEIVNRIEQDLQSATEHEIPSEALGEIVLRHLRKLDQVAYVRFASVYRQFQDIGSFMSELDKLRKEE